MHLQVYIHTKSYPSNLITEHEYAVGDIPEDVLRETFKNEYMKQMYQDANPFQYVRNLNQI